MAKIFNIIPEFLRQIIGKGHTERKKTVINSRLLKKNKKKKNQKQIKIT